MNFKQEKKAAMQKTHKALNKIRSETRSQIVTALVAAFAFVIALVWNEVITTYSKEIITFFSFPGSEHIYLLYTAILTTIIAVIGIMIVNKWANKQN